MAETQALQGCEVAVFIFISVGILLVRDVRGIRVKMSTDIHSPPAISFSSLKSQWFRSVNLLEVRLQSRYSKQIKIKDIILQDELDFITGSF